MIKQNQSQAAHCRAAIHGVRGMWDTFYWINEAMKRHIQEFTAQPAILTQLKSLDDGAIDLIARLEQLRSDANKLKLDILTAGSALRIAELESPSHATREADLSVDELTALRLMNTRLDEVGRKIKDATEQVESDLDARLANLGDQLRDYEVDVKLDFYLKNDDPGFSGDDNTVSRVEFLVGDPTDQYPDGYLDAMPHGQVFHTLHYYGGYDRSEVDYRDMLRIGTVWVDVVVRHQYEYDLTTGRWISPAANPL